MERAASRFSALSALFKITVYTAPSGHPFLPASFDAASTARSSSVTHPLLSFFNRASASSGRKQTSSKRCPSESSPYRETTCVVRGSITGSCPAGILSGIRLAPSASISTGRDCFHILSIISSGRAPSFLPSRGIPVHACPNLSIRSASFSSNSSAAKGAEKNLGSSSSCM